MTSHELPEDSRVKQGDEDTEAILSRRRFLIFSTLAGAGIGQRCWAAGPSHRSRRCASKSRRARHRRSRPPEPNPCPEGQLPKPPEPKPCLSVPPPPRPQPPSPGPKP